MYYTERKLKNKKRGRPGDKARQQGITVTQPTNILRGLTNVIAGGSSLNICHCRKVRWSCAVKFVNVMFVIMLMMAITCLTSLICTNKNNGDKFYHKIHVGGWRETNSELGHYAAQGIDVDLLTYICNAATPVWLSWLAAHSPVHMDKDLVG